ncbi:MAG: TAXI family TRAP transporter solute-binding subunit [Sphaerochaeta sp.]|jgi:TRAP transporter TAXI family solute receptor
MKKVGLAVVVFIVGMAVLFAAGKTEVQKVESDYGVIPTYMSLGSSPSGQAAYTMSAGIASVVNNAKIGTTLTVEETGGFPVNVQLLMNDEIEFGMINNMMEEQVYLATGPYAQYPKGKVLTIVNLGAAEMHIIVPADSPIQSIYDFAGYRVGIGHPGGIVLDVTTMFLDALGYKKDDFKRFDINLANQASYMQDGQLDVLMWIGGAPLAAVSELIASKKVRFLPIDDEAIRKMQQYSSVIEKTEIAANSYPNQNTAVPTFCTRQILVAREDVSNEAVYQVTKLMMENVKALAAVHISMGTISPETAVLGLNENTPLHPGAARYYTEIGMDVAAITAK